MMMRLLLATVVAAAATNAATPDNVSSRLMIHVSFSFYGAEHS